MSETGNIRSDSLHGDVLEQAGAQRSVPLELLQKDEVSSEDHLLIEELGPVQTVVVRFSQHQHLPETQPEPWEHALLKRAALKATVHLNPNLPETQPEQWEQALLKRVALKATVHLNPNLPETQPEPWEHALLKQVALKATVPPKPKPAGDTARAVRAGFTETSRS